MTNVYEVEASARSDVGKGASRRLRHKELVPAIIYGAKKPAQSLTLEHRKIIKSLSFEAFFSKILTINIDGSKEKAVLKAVQRHPFKPKVLHLDFQRISESEKLTMHVPFHFLGEDVAPGVKAGGIISHQMSNIEVMCLPAHLPEFIEVDISLLELDHAVHLSEIKLPEHVELTLHVDESHNPGVVSIHLPRVELEPEPEEEVAEGAEGEASGEAAEGSEDKKDAKSDPSSAKDDKAK